MKNIFLAFVLICFAIKPFAQTDTSINFSKQYYLTTSRHQKTAAIVLISGGGALFCTGGIIEMSHLGSDLGNFWTGNGKQHDDTGPSILILAGAASMLGSIPLFISAQHNKKKALSVSFKPEFVPELQSNTIPTTLTPGISMVLRF